MRILFMGTPDFAVATLDALVDAGHDVVCVVAQPDRPKGRGNKLQSPPTIERARALAIPTRQPKAVRSGPFVRWVTRDLDVDVAVVVAYGRILIPEILAAPRRGCINVHASLLPLYRGAAPIQWAILQGEAETGVCTMQMDAGMDTGAVLGCRKTPIGIDETGPELWARLALLGADLLVDTLAKLDAIKPQAQDHDKATHAPMLTKADGLLDWGWTARRLHDRVRGTNPWPSGQTRFRGEDLKIHQTRLCADRTDAAPGTVLSIGDRLTVAAGDGGMLELVEVQLPGKKRQPARDFANGSRLELGEVLG